MTTFTLDDDKPVLFQKLIEAEIEEKVRRAENEFLMKLKEEQVSNSSTLNERVFHTNVLLYVRQSQNVTRKAAKKTFVQKIRTFNVDEIDGRSTFHRHLTSSFFIQNCFE